MTKIEHLQTFLAERPAISVSILAKESGIPESTLRYIITPSGKEWRRCNLTELRWSKLVPVMSRYGYTVEL